MTTTLPEVDEKLLQEQVRIEKLKGPKGGGTFVPQSPTAEEIEWRTEHQKRQEAAAKQLRDRARPTD